MELTCSQGFGAIPALIALYCRLTIPETPRYTFDVTRDVEQGFADYKAFCMNTIGPMNSRGQVSAEREDIRSRLNDQSLGGLDAKAVPQSSWKDFKNYFGKRRNLLALIGTAGSWFFLDVAYYALLLNNVIVLQKVGFGAVSHDTEHSIYTILRNGAVGNLVLVVAGAIPGSILAILLVDKIGRKSIQIAGFFMMTLLLIILGSAFNSISDSSRVALYVLILFFVNFGKLLYILERDPFNIYPRAEHDNFHCAGRVLPYQIPEYGPWYIGSLGKAGRCACPSSCGTAQNGWLQRGRN